MPFAVVVLFFGAFCVGTTEFVIAGLLPVISRDLGISIPNAGYLISAYAVGVAIGGPVLTLAISRFPRKRNLLLLMAIFIAGHVWCATSQGFASLMAGRLVVALSHGSFFGVASVVAVSIVPENRRGAAIAWLFAGISVANILGVPGGTAIGNWLGWRATFWVVCGAAVLASVAMVISIPQDNEAAGDRAGIGAQISAIINQKVLLSYLAFAVMLVGFWSFFTFVAPHLTIVVGITQQQVPLLLFLFGTGATVGTILGGRLADRIPAKTLAFGLPSQALAFIAVLMASVNPYLMALVLFVFGVIMFIPASSIVNRVLQGASRAPDLASTLVSTAANIGIAAGAVVGSQALSAGLGYSQLPWIGILFATLAACVMLVSLKIEKAAVARPLT